MDLKDNRIKASLKIYKLIHISVYKMLTRKEIIALNQEFHEGKVINAGSLDLALDQARKTRDWLKAAAFISRAIVVDHIFEDGNKRTGAAVIATYIDMQNLNFNQERVDKAVLEMAKKSINDIHKLMRLIKHATE